VEPANVPPVPRAGDAPAVVWVCCDKYGTPCAVLANATIAANWVQSPPWPLGNFPPYRAETYTRVPDAATLDARIAAVEDAIMELRVAAGSLKAASDNSTSGTSHLMLRQSSDKRRQSAKVLDALLTGLRAARDAAGRDA
jgi:hypothetical protein